MRTRSDDRLRGLILATLSREGPVDVLRLLDVLRRAEPKLLARHEGHLHPLLHSLVQRGLVVPQVDDDAALARYAVPTNEQAPERTLTVPAGGPHARVARRVASAARGEVARSRIAADVAVHLSVAPDAFGSTRTARHLLRRADRKRPSVFFAADGREAFRRFVLHEGPWILGAAILFLVVRAFFAEVFVIPSESMVPTLLKRDRVVVWKPGGSGMPDRWSICTFDRWGTTYVKRAVGLGDETIALVDGDVYIDGLLAAKPDEVREALRLPYARYDFDADAALWARTQTDSATVWTWNGGDLFSARPEGPRAGGDVRLRDVYLDLEVTREQPGRVDLELLYVHPDGHTTGGERTLTLHTHPGVGLTVDGAVDLEALRIVREGTNDYVPHVRLRLSQVDGVVRAEVQGWRFELPLDLAPGFVASFRVRVENADGVATARPLTLLVDRDLHYSQTGDLGVPDIGSDDDPRSYAFQIPADHVFFLGDNSHNSKDSRYRIDQDLRQIGPVPAADLIGPVSFRIWPPGRWGRVR